MRVGVLGGYWRFDTKTTGKIGILTQNNRKRRYIRYPPRNRSNAVILLFSAADPAAPVTTRVTAPVPRDSTIPVTTPVPSSIGYESDDTDDTRNGTGVVQYWSVSADTDDTSNGTGVVQY